MSKLLDISGNGNNGTISGGAVLSKDGMKFDGVDDYVTVTNSADFDGVKSISVRFKYDKLDSNSPIRYLVSRTATTDYKNASAA